MNIKQFRETEAFIKNPISTPITFLIFGGQGSVFISKLEYCPSKKQVKLLTESQETYQGPATVEDLIRFPGDTEILIEGYPGDDFTPTQWVTPDNVELYENAIDFQSLSEEE